MKEAPDQNKARRFWLIFLVLCVLTVISLNGIVTVSKYVLHLNAYRQADAKAFYFTSDLLSAGDTPVFQIVNFVPGTSTIRFYLRNYSDALHVSETDISYTISTGNASVAGATGTVAQNGTTLVNHPVTLAVPQGAFSNGKATIRVTATANMPYTATLSAVFELYERNTNVRYTVYDTTGNNTVTLTVTTGDNTETLHIVFPAAIYPDPTDSRLTVESATACRFSAVANGQYSFVFFKSNPSLTYSVSDFSVN